MAAAAMDETYSIFYRSHTPYEKIYSDDLKNSIFSIDAQIQTDNDEEELCTNDYFRQSPDKSEHNLKDQIASLIQANKEKDAMIASLNDQVANLQLISESIAGSIDSSVSVSTAAGAGATAEKVADHHHGCRRLHNCQPSSSSSPTPESSPTAEEDLSTEPAGCLTNELGQTSIEMMFETGQNSAKTKAYRSNSVNMTGSLNSPPSIGRRTTRDFSGYSSDGATSHRRLLSSSMTAAAAKNCDHHHHNHHFLRNHYDDGDSVMSGSKSSSSKMNASSSANTVYGFRNPNRGLWNILDRFISINRSKREKFANPRANFSMSEDDRFADRPHQSYNPAELAFSRWTTDQVCSWMVGIGLGSYVGACRRNIRSGLSIITATHGFLEKDLGMRNMLHRKRLLIYLESLCNPCSSGPEPKSVRDLDLFWVQKWLDDIGLPQYKDAFLDAKIDGRMLHKLTIDDLVYMNITNELHHLSIRRAIQILRLNNFDCDCLRRRPSQDDLGRGIILWSNHRVMEWLRSVDLSEYAPNLRGSGVHGALVALEPRFNAETLADILSIPSTKTLLRRHLSTEFAALVGNEAEAKKIEVVQSKNYRKLNIHSKVKASSKSKYAGFFSTTSGGSSKKGYCDRFDRLICPPINTNSQEPSRMPSKDQCYNCSTRSHRQFRSASRGAPPQTTTSRFPSYKSKHSPTTFV